LRITEVPSSNSRVIEELPLTIISSFKKMGSNKLVSLSSEALFLIIALPLISEIAPI